MEFHPLLVAFIDTAQLQRLRYIKQLGQQCIIMYCVCTVRVMNAVIRWCKLRVSKRDTHSFRACSRVSTHSLHVCYFFKFKWMPIFLHQGAVILLLNWSGTFRESNLSWTSRMLRYCVLEWRHSATIWVSKNDHMHIGEFEHIVCNWYPQLTGHGPFSHMFQNFVALYLQSDCSWSVSSVNY